MALSKKDRSFILLNQHNEDEVLIDRIKEYVNISYPNEKTRANRLSLMKKCVIENEILDDQKNAVNICDQKLYHKLRCEKIIPDKQLITKEQVHQITQLKDSDNKFEILTYLLFQSGRRIGEFLKGKFEIKNEKLYIDKLDKKRDIKPKSGGYEIQLLDESPDGFMSLLDKFNKLRTKPSSGDYIKNETIKCKTCVSIKASTDGQFKVKDLRPLYIASMKLKPEYKLKNSNSLVQKLLHHEGLGVTVHYNDVFEII